MSLGELVAALQTLLYKFAREFKMSSISLLTCILHGIISYYSTIFLLLAQMSRWKTSRRHWMSANNVELTTFFACEVVWPLSDINLWCRSTKGCCGLGSPRRRFHFGCWISQMGTSRIWWLFLHFCCWYVSSISLFIATNRISRGSSFNNHGGGEFDIDSNREETSFSDCFWSLCLQRWEIWARVELFKVQSR